MLKFSRSLSLVCPMLAVVLLASPAAAATVSPTGATNPLGVETLEQFVTAIRGEGAEIVEKQARELEFDGTTMVVTAASFVDADGTRGAVVVPIDPASSESTAFVVTAGDPNIPIYTISEGSAVEVASIAAVGPIPPGACEQLRRASAEFICSLLPGLGLSDVLCLPFTFTPYGIVCSLVIDALQGPLGLPYNPENVNWSGAASGGIEVYAPWPRDRFTGSYELVADFRIRPMGCQSGATTGQGCQVAFGVSDNRIRIALQWPDRLQAIAFTCTCSIRSYQEYYSGATNATAVGNAVTAFQFFGTFVGEVGIGRAVRSYVFGP